MDLECEGWTRILEIFPDMDFTQELQERPELTKYMRQAINSKSLGYENPLSLSNAPKLDEDFSKYILLNGLPKCDEKKSAKLLSLLLRLFQKKNFTITEESIEFSWDENKVTTGQAFVKLNTDEQAKISAAQFNGYKLDAKHTFSACTFPDFDKIMDMGKENEEEGNQPAKTGFLELNDHCLETKKSVYAYQKGKQVLVHSLHGQTKVLYDQEEEEKKSECDPFQSDKPFLWSPKGTYLVLIKSDKVEFVGGSNMQPILTINEPKVETVIFSPCEKYLVVYSPKSDFPYAVWNFMTHEKIREFEQERDEDSTTFKWNFNGTLIAKKTIKVVEQEGQEDQTKTYITTYDLPSMKMSEDMDGNKTSIYIDGLKEFQWAPNKNWIVYTSFPSATNMQPRVTFMELPSRRQLSNHTFKDSTDLKMYYHPQGTYLALMNEFLNKKTTRYSVELFDLKDNRGQIPHQQIVVEREVAEFYGVYWEPNKSKFAIHTKAKKILEPGQRQYSNDPYRSGIDMYLLSSDKELGFQKKLVGYMNPEKVLELHFAGSGDILCTIEQEALNRVVLNFYIIRKIVDDSTNTSQNVRNKGGPALQANQDTYEFIKTARHELKEKKWIAKWDAYGRYFMLQGRKTLSIDRNPKSVRFFNMFGEMLDMIPEVVGLDQVRFRPRPTDIIKPEKLKKLKKEYKNKYEQIFKEEENAEKKAQNDIVKDQKKKIRQDFLDNFFIPLRQEYESNISKYESLFPIKEKDMADEQATITNIFHFGDTINQRKLEMS